MKRTLQNNVDRLNNEMKSVKYSIKVALVDRTKTFKDFTEFFRKKVLGQPGKEVDDYACAMAWTPMLLVENALHTRHTSSAVESFRNEMVKANESSQALLRATAEAKDKLIQFKDVSDV